MKAGQNHTLTVTRISDYGLYLADQEGQEVLLPNRYVSLADKVGDAVDVFVYHDSEDRLVATRETPLARAGEAAFLKVVDKNLHGAFLDWGLAGKDLFLPNRNQQGGIFAGRSYVVYVYVDDVTGRCVATNKLKSFVNNETLTVRPREEVDLLVASESEIGYRVVIDNRHWGMLYCNQLFRPVQVGDRLRGYVTKSPTTTASTCRSDSRAMPACRTVPTSCSACCAKRAGGCRSATTARRKRFTAARSSARRRSNVRWASCSNAGSSRPMKKGSN